MTDAIPTPNDLTGLQGKLDDIVETTREARTAAEEADPIGDGSYAGDATKTSLVDTPDLDEAEAAASAPIVERRVSDADETF